MGYDMAMSCILFDIDNTLIDTGQLVNQGFKPALQKFLGVDDSDFTIANETYWQTLADSTDFSPESYSTFLAKRYSQDQAALLEIIYTPEWYTQNIFSEVIETLQTLAPSHRLGIFSQGNDEYQRQKLELSGLISFFEPDLLFISNRKITSENIALLPEAIVIDDRWLVIEALLNKSKITPIWLHRKQKFAQEKSLEIQSLLEIEKTIRGL